MAHTSEYKQDRKFGDSFIPHLRDILKQDITIAEEVDDRFYATDLFIAGKRVAFRVRKAGYPEAEFTIRLSRPSNAHTELEKILSGYGDYLIYCHSTPNANEHKIARLVIIDLSVFRRCHKYVNHAHLTNKDGTEFNAYRLSSFPKSLVLFNENILA